VTVLEVIQRSTEFLAQKGVESPRLQIELLLAHVLRLPRLQLYLDYQRKLTEAELNSVRDLVRRRGRREPLQYIIGSTSFCGLEVTVNPAVLVPRPETELLAERAVEFLNERVAEGPPVALDLGTGSGCIAIALAVKSTRARVYACDVSAEALEVARQNAAHHEVADRIEFLKGEGFAAVASSLRFDLIVSNPPYIPSAEVAGLQPEVRDYEPLVALDGGPDGLTFFRRLAVESLPHLKPDSRIMLELGYGQDAAVRRIFAEQKWIVEMVEPDYTGQPRILMASWPR
jgi:release factor glutamine methyltransferase